MGGRNKLPMKDLTKLLESLDCQQVKTYIQSGNAAFQHATTEPHILSTHISSAIQASHGFEPAVLILPAKSLQQAIAENPFTDAGAAPKTLHLYFLTSVPANPNFEKMATLKADSEQFELRKNVFYLHAPDGIGRSKLAAQAEKLLGVAATARNWRTVSKLAEMLETA